MRVYSTEDYYSNEKDIKDKMLDEVTLSHLLRKDNNFTKQGKPYGRLLCEFLSDNGLLNEDTSILEIGPGLGDIACEIKKFANETDLNCSYTAIDISPSIIENMESLGFNAVKADCMEMPFENKSFDLVIANEVISDLPTIIDFDANYKGDESVFSEAKKLINKYKLSYPDYNFNFNFGAIKIVSEMGRVLRNGGGAFIAEQSSGSRWPERISVVGHDEYTINFNHMESAAKANGFSVKRGNINDILGADKNKLFVSGILRPDIKTLYDMERSEKSIEEIMSGIFEPDEFIQKLIDSQALNIFNIKKYGEFIKKNAEPLERIISQFEYLLLKK